MAAITTALVVGALAISAAATGFSAHESAMGAKSAKGAREQATRDAKAAADKLVSDKKAATELAAAQIEDRKRALARNAANTSGTLGVEEGGQQVKKVLGQ